MKKRNARTFLCSRLSQLVSEGTATRSTASVQGCLLYWCWLVPDQRMVRVNIQFSGGLEILFDNQSTIAVDVSPPKEQTELDIAHLLLWLRDNLLTERPELFMQGNTVRPGILVLVNDVDWELSGMLETIIEDDDTVVFISTLHGG